MEGHQQLDRAIPPSWVGLNVILFFLPWVHFLFKIPLKFGGNISMTNDHGATKI